MNPTLSFLATLLEALLAALIIFGLFKPSYRKNALYPLGKITLVIYLPLLAIIAGFHYYKTLEAAATKTAQYESITSIDTVQTTDSTPVTVEKRTDIYPSAPGLWRDLNDKVNQRKSSTTLNPLSISGNKFSISANKPGVAIQGTTNTENGEVTTLSIRIKKALAPKGQELMADVLIPLIFLIEPDAYADNKLRILDSLTIVKDRKNYLEQQGIYKDIKYNLKSVKGDLELKLSIPSPSDTVEARPATETITKEAPPLAESTAKGLAEEPQKTEVVTRKYVYRSLIHFWREFGTRIEKHAALLQAQTGKKFQLEPSYIRENKFRLKTSYNDIVFNGTTNNETAILALTLQINNYPLLHNRQLAPTLIADLLAVIDLHLTKKEIEANFGQIKKIKAVNGNLHKNVTINGFNYNLNYSSGSLTLAIKPAKQ